MIRRIHCEKCRGKLALHAEDKVQGWHLRRGTIVAQVPDGHGFSVNGEFHPLKELVCDSCGDTIPNGATAETITMYRGEPPEIWEREFAKK